MTTKEIEKKLREGARKLDEYFESTSAERIARVFERIEEEETMTKQLLNQLKANLKFIENPENYFSMFRQVISSCTTAEFANKTLFAAEAISESTFSENARRISEAKQRAIQTHGEWTIKTLEESKSTHKHTVRTFVATLYSDIFGTDDSITLCPIAEIVKKIFE